MKLTIAKKLIILTIVICSQLGFTLSLTGQKIVREKMIAEIERGLQASTFGISQTMRELTLLTEMNAMLEEFHTATGIDATIFRGKERVGSTIPGAVGTDMSNDVWNALQTGEEFFATDVMVQGELYFGYYIPFFVDGECTGAVFTGVPQAEAETDIASAKHRMYFVLYTAMPLSIGIALLLAREMSKKSNVTVGHIDKLSDENDLRMEYNNKYRKENDELEKIYNRVFKFANNLKGIIGSIKNASVDLRDISSELDKQTITANRSTEEIATAVQNVASGAESQARDTEEATKQIAEIGVNIDNIVADSVALLDAAAHMTTIKDTTMIDISAVDKIADALRTDVDEVNTQIDITSASVGDIRKFVGVIHEIADQTNLLSLNASIEAARAGDAGRGFAVVAEEIRKLAEQATTSAADVEEVINGLLKNYELIVDKMRVTTANIQAQSEKISNTDKSFADLENAIRDASTKIEGIKQTTVVLNDEKNKIVDTIANLSAISEENAAATQEVMAGIQELNAIVTNVAEKATIVDEKAASLLDNVNVFRVD